MTPPTTLPRAEAALHTSQMRVPFRLLDVFAETPFAGNQLCVVPDVPEGPGAGDDAHARARDRVLGDDVRDGGAR